MVEHKLVSFATVVALCRTLGIFTNKASAHTPKVEIHARQKLCHFGRYVAKAKGQNLASKRRNWLLAAGIG